MDSSRRTVSDRSKGLTLLELTVAVAIVGILASLAMPRFGILRDGFRATAAAEQLAVELRKLQLRARAEGYSVQIRDGRTNLRRRNALALQVTVERGDRLERRPLIVVIEDARLRVVPFGPFRVTARGEFLNEGGFVRSPIRFALAEAERTVFVQRSGRIVVR